MANSTPPDNNGKTYNKRAIDPRSTIFKQYYIDPQSPTFMNVLQSALRAGYSQEYSESLGYQNPKWFDELMTDKDVERAKMLNEAEKGLYEAVTYDSDDKERAKMKLQASVYVTERLGKTLYSSRQEVTGADGRRLFSSETRASASVPVANLFKGVAKDA